MNAERRERVVKMLRGLRNDIEVDVDRREGLPFTGRNVSEALGEICAQIDAIAAVAAP